MQSLLILHFLIKNLSILDFDFSNFAAVFPEPRLRFLAPNAIAKETGPDSFAASHITKTLAIPGVKGGINHKFVIFSSPKVCRHVFLELTKCSTNKF